VEIASISQVFCEDVKREGNLNVGSIKSNIGHLESVSGIAGLLKAVVVLKKGLIPPNIDFINPKPSLKLNERNITVRERLKASSCGEY
jgi:acyl transferase domain-containing protein